MLTQTAKYAIRALLHLAEQKGSGYCQTKDIAETIEVPANYLGKTLQKLAAAPADTQALGEAHRAAHSLKSISATMNYQEPRAVHLGERRLLVLAITDRWYDPDADCFRIRLDDGSGCLIRYARQEDCWYLVTASVSFD